MNILITGGAGYIGSTLIPMLLDRGYEVTCVDTFMYRQSPLLDQCHRPNFHIIKGDARDFNILRPLIKKADLIIPLACLTGAPICKNDPLAATSINRDAILELLKHKSKDQMLIYPCTNSGYGIGIDGIFCDETSPLNPISLYGKLKVEAETALLDSGHCLTFRFATVFGSSPRMRLDLLVNDFVYRAIFDRTIVLFEAHFKRNYLHIRDAARVFIHALDNYQDMVGEAYNVGLSDANLSKEELCNRIQSQIPNFKYLIAEIGEDIDKRNYIISNDKVEATGFKPKYSLDHGITELQKTFNIIKRMEYGNV
jgi:nucleoside-diphosphate-sugar epimerase